MTTIAIIGANGFIGRRLVEYFCTQNEVISLSRSQSQYAPQSETKKIHTIHWDITTHYNGKVPPVDICIHTAANINYTGEYEDLYQSNVASVENVLWFAERSGCKHFIYLSSSSVYMGQSGLITEEVTIDNTNLTNPYARTKHEAEERLKTLIPSHIKLTILRPRAVYGIGDKTLLPQILSHTLCGYLFLPWPGTYTTSATSIESVVEAIEVCIKHQQSQLGIYNVCDSVRWSYNDIYREIARARQLRGIIHIPPFVMRILMHVQPKKWQYLYDTFCRDKILDTKKIKKLGFMGKNKLRETIHSEE